MALVIPQHWHSPLLRNRALASVAMFYQPDKSLVAEFVPHAGAEGPRAYAHGGFLATVLDETMGYACWLNGLPVLAAQLAVRYRKSVPLDGSYRVHARIQRLEKKRAVVTAELVQQQNLFCEATGIFVRVPLSLLEQQPELAQLAEIVGHLGSGVALAELIARSEVRQKPWSELEQRARYLATEALALVQDFSLAMVHAFLR